MGEQKPSDRRARAEQLRKERERSERRRRNAITGGIVAAVVVLIAVAGIGIYAATNNDDEGSGTDLVGFPADGIVYDQEAATGEASDGDPVDVVIYEDFQCPACKAFDQATRDLVADYVADGTIRVAYEPLNYIDQMMGGSTSYSLEAANAATCVFEQQDGQAFHEFSALLFDDQLPEGSPGFSDQQYVAYAKQAGATGIESCLSGRPHQGEIEDRTRTFATSAVGKDGTPSVVVDGEKLADISPQGLSAAIDEAAG
ncbi:MAG: DsbA family protein [Nocardioidaceae bacterium]